jgi:hypothetical protein
MSRLANINTCSSQSLNTLHARGVDISIQGGKRVISTSSYNSSSSEDSQATVDLPVFLISRETLKWFEITEDKANQIWSSWERLDSQFQRAQDFSHWVMDLLKIGASNAIGSSADWRRSFLELGVTREFQDRVMDPAWTYWRLKYSAFELVEGNIEARYEVLKNFDMLVARHDPSGARGQHNAQQQQQSAGVVVPPCSSSNRGGRPAVGTFQRSRPAVRPDPRTIWEDTTDCTILWKGGSLGRLQSVFRPDNSLNFPMIISHPPGDFNEMDETAYYFTPQRQLAWEYAQWAHRWVDGRLVPVGILKVCIPNHIMESRQAVDPGDWKQFVFMNRRGLTLPRELQRYLDTDWLVGPACTDGADVFNGHQNYSAVMPHKLGRGECSKQYVARRAVGRELNTACVGRVEVTPVLGR